MAIQRLSTVEAMSVIAQAPKIEVAITSDRFALNLQVQETRSRVRLVVNGGEAEVVYEANDGIAPEVLQEEIGRHSALLELARTLRTNEYALTERTVDRETDIQDGLQSMPPWFKHTIIFIAKIVASIWALLQFKSPFVKRAMEKDNSNKLMALAVLIRSISEINKRKQHYENLLREDGSNQQLVELIGVMREVVVTLGNVRQTRQNSLLSEGRALEVAE